MVKVEKYINVACIKPYRCPISSKVGLIASIFSKVSSILWAKPSLRMYFPNNNIADIMIVKIEY